MRVVAVIFVILASLAASLPARAEPVREAIAAISADVLFLRHALAPGYGDPDNFVLGDCSTQRNLDGEGREQARMIGAYLKRTSITPDAILSSQWCRCRDTATEMKLGDWKDFPGLNSFFEGHADRNQTLRLLEQRMAKLNPGDLVLMVTHQVVISAVTDIAPPSGGLVAYNSRTGEARPIRLPISN